MTQSKAIVLVDYENIAIPLSKQQKKLEIKKDFFGSVGRNYAENVEVCVVYNFEKFTSDTSILGKFRYQLLNASSGKKNSADITLAVEAIDLAYKHIGKDNIHFVFLCGDADYLPVFQKFDSLKIPFTVYAVKGTVGEDFEEYFKDITSFGNLFILDDIYPDNIVPVLAMDPNHVIVLKQLGIAESKNRNKPVSFHVFRGYLTQAVKEFGKKLTDQEAADLIDEVVTLGYVNKDQEVSLQGRPRTVFCLNQLNVQVVNLLVQAQV